MNIARAGVVLAFAALLLATVSSTARAVAPLHAWSLGAGSLGTDIGFGVAIDASRNIVTTGYYRGTIDFGGGPIAPAGFTDIYVAKYSSTGAHLWSYGFGGVGNDMGLSIATDAFDNVFVSGFFSDTLSFGGAQLVSTGSDNLFIAKFSPSGVHLWSHGFGGPADGGPAGGGWLAVDQSGSVVVGGGFAGTVDFGGGPLVSVGPYDVYLAKFDPTGAHLWSQRFGGSGIDFGNRIAIDGLDNVVIVGYFEASVNFGGALFTSAGDRDIFVAKYDSGGVHQWSRSFGGAGADQATAVATDMSQQVAVVGTLTGSVSLGGAIHPGVGSRGFVARYGESGTYDWSADFDAPLEEVHSVATDPAENVIVTGRFTETMDLGGGSLLTSAGSLDAFVAMYTGTGSLCWSQRFGGIPGGDIAFGVASNAALSFTFTGAFSGTADLGGGPMTSIGSSDTFLATYQSPPHDAFISTIQDVGNDQGGWVRIAFDPSDYDVAAAPNPIHTYDVYRRVAPVPAWRTHFQSNAATGPLSWELVTAIPAHGEGVYHVIAPTLADSTVTYGMYRSSFFIRAQTSTPSIFFDSPIDSGYSLDNLSPPPPANLVYEEGVLAWDPSRAHDFDHYSVYGSASRTMNASAVWLGHTTEARLDVSSATHAYYYVTATDRSGNEGDAARASAQTGGGEPANYVLGVNAYPNPFNPATTIRYDVPSKGSVTVAVYDARGTRVATLVQSERAAGSYTVRWAGQDGRGHLVSSGVYFVRLDFGAQTRTRKVVLLK